MTTDTPQVLIPFDRSEAITLKQAAALAGRSQSTVRIWCQTYCIGRRVPDDGHWFASHPALLMLLDGDQAALREYLKGDRESESVLQYFDRAAVARPAKPSLPTKIAERAKIAEALEAL